MRHSIESMALPARLAYRASSFNDAESQTVPIPKSRAVDSARIRERRRAAGLTSIEAILHREDVASLDELKAQLGLASRSDVLRVLIAKVDRTSLSPADTAVLNRDAA